MGYLMNASWLNTVQNACSVGGIMLRIALWLVLERSLSPLPYTSVGAVVDTVTSKPTFFVGLDVVLFISSSRRARLLSIYKSSLSVSSWRAALPLPCLSFR